MKALTNKQLQQIMVKSIISGLNLEKRPTRIASNEPKQLQMKIGGVSVNPKEFFDNWKEQMQGIVLEKAQELVAEKLGSKKMREMQDRLYQYEQVLESWEKEINWEVKNPLIGDV